MLFEKRFGERLNISLNFRLTTNRYLVNKNSNVPFLPAFSTTEWHYKTYTKSLGRYYEFRSCQSLIFYFSPLKILSYLTIVKNAKNTTH